MIIVLVSDEPDNDEFVANAMFSILEDVEFVHTNSLIDMAFGC